MFPRGERFAPAAHVGGEAVRVGRAPCPLVVEVGRRRLRDEGIDDAPLLFERVGATETARVAFQSSPLAFVSTWRSPVLLIHGDDDRNVPFTESVALAEALRARGVEVEQLVFPDEIHDFLRHESWVRAYRAADEFLERRLKTAAAAAPLNR